ncbi:hypothetical protein CR983_01455 [Candidatus Saccharibacteria bacterium]|nr:MAG: hypothetical protein CR983_01455 [Candidatus Saccharibacteria bacterium]
MPATRTAHEEVRVTVPAYVAESLRAWAEKEHVTTDVLARRALTMFFALMAHSDQGRVLQIVDPRYTVRVFVPRGESGLHYAQQPTTQ